MKNIQLGCYIKSWYLDFFCIALIIGTNPVAYFFSLSPGIFPPDTFAYATMARDLFQKGLLYLPAWGHIDNGLVLPPLFPFLIACGRFFSPETLNVAEFVSSISILLFTIPVFFFIKETANRIIAVIAIIPIQINYYFFLIGMRPLTESVFLLTIGLTLWLALLFFKRPAKKQKVLAFILGISCSLVFFSRQVGIIIYVFIGILFLLQWILLSANDRRTLLKNFLFVVCGSLVLLVPYTTVLYLQTGQHPLTQGFKKNEYVIKVDDPKILNEIEQEKGLPGELLELIKTKTQPDQDYGIIYAERRRMRKLLPDSSEMYAHVYVEGEVKTGNIKKALSNFIDPGAYFIRLYNNVLHLKSVMGVYAAILFFISCLSSLMVKMDSGRDLSRFLLPSFVIIYLLIISLLTDKIARYIYVLFPFCVMHISLEAYRYFNRFRDLFKRRWFGLLFLSVLFSSILLTTPRFFTELHLNQKFIGMGNGYGNNFKSIVNEEPVFSLFAYEAYLIGSPYRILPNDSLEKVAAYGKKTGVRWILLYHGRSSASELRLYDNLNWYSNRLLEGTYPDLVKFRLGTLDGAMALYEIL